MQVRKAVLSDTDFLLHSAVTMAHETEGKVLDQIVVRKGIEDCIGLPKLGCYYVVENEEGKCVGTLGLTYEVSLQVGGQITWIQSVYVVPEARRLGVFRAMYNHVVAEAKADPQVVCVRLYVETENEKAKAVYSAMGMTQMDDYSFEEKDFILGH